MFRRVCFAAEQPVARMMMCMNDGSSPGVTGV
jgi:hypothetical protein